MSDSAFEILHLLQTILKEKFRFLHLMHIQSPGLSITCPMGDSDGLWTQTGRLQLGADQNRQAWVNEPRKNLTNSMASLEDPRGSRRR